MKKKNLIRISGVVLGLAGFGVLAYVGYPIVSYQLHAPALMTFLSPLAENTEVLASSDSNNVDYTKVSNWFPTASENSNLEKNPVSFYKISIPRLGIRDATVSVGGEDLTQSLVQYPGTALPGQIGNAVIFGHSVLPSFYDPTNYLTIFSTIPTLVQGDAISVNFDGITYKYSVTEKYEVEPTDLGILDQDQSDSFLTLVTCVPPGLTTRRGIIKARIVPIKTT